MVSILVTAEKRQRKKLPNLPNKTESMTTFYEQQIQELATAEEALEIEREEVAKF